MLFWVKKEGKTVQGIHAQGRKQNTYAERQAGWGGCQKEGMEASMQDGIGT